MRRGIEVSEKILDPTRVYCNRIVTLDVFQENHVQTNIHDGYSSADSYFPWRTAMLSAKADCQGECRTACRPPDVHGGPRSPTRPPDE
jgi:hypothetical protein